MKLVGSSCFLSLQKEMFIVTVIKYGRATEEILKNVVEKSLK